MLQHMTTLKPIERVNYWVDRRADSEEEVSVLLAELSAESEGLAMLIDLRATALKMTQQFPAPKPPTSVLPDSKSDYINELPKPVPRRNWAQGLLGSSYLSVSHTALNNLKKTLYEVIQRSITQDALDLNIITKDSRPDILAGIIEGERVHAFTDESGLLVRLADNRRVFTVTHKLLPHRPLAILHVAVSKGMFQCVTDILEGLPEHSTPSTLCGGAGELDEAPFFTFYSVSSIESGLRGIPCGHYMIGKAKANLQQERATYVTLSPIPGYRAWLHVALKRGNPIVQQIAGEFHDEVVAMTQTHASVPSHLKPILEQLAVNYLIQQKQRGKILDPVGHFHVGNGAIIWGMRWAGERSYDMSRNSFGLMVNYLYCEEGEGSKEDYLINNAVTIGEPLSKMHASMEPVVIKIR